MQVSAERAYRGSVLAQEGAEVGVQGAYGWGSEATAAEAPAIGPAWSPPPKTRQLMGVTGTQKPPWLQGQPLASRD